MNISTAARESGLNTKTLRFYEEIELCVPARAENGYRVYKREDLHRLKFIQRARSLGFTVAECRQLLSLYQDDNRTSADVKRIALERIRQVDEKIRELQTLRETLKALADTCHGDDRPTCPILEDLSGS